MSQAAMPLRDFNYFIIITYSIFWVVYNGKLNLIKRDNQFDFFFLNIMNLFMRKIPYLFRPTYTKHTHKFSRIVSSMYTADFSQKNTCRTACCFSFIQNVGKEGPWIFLIFCYATYSNKSMTEEYHNIVIIKIKIAG